MKKFLPLLLLIGMIFLFVGCGEKDALSIAAGDESVSLTVGDTKKIEPVVAGKKDIVWNSSDTNVATVSAEGVISAVTAGTAKITVSLKDTEISAEISVTVKWADATAVTVTGAGTVVVGGTLQLAAVVAPTNANQAVTWTSSSSALAAVDASGKVTGKSPGEVTITATAADSAVKKTVTVTVVFPDPATITITGPDEVVVGKSITLVHTVAPAYALEGVAWSVDNPEIAEFTSGSVLTGITAGTVVVKATSLIKPEIFGEYTVTVLPPDPESVVVSGPEEVELGETATYKAVVMPEQAPKGVVWSTDDEEIATITQAGVLKGLKEGTVTVIATSVALDTVFGELVVEVKILKEEVVLHLNDGKWPITGTDPFAQGKPQKTIKVNVFLNPKATDYYVSDTEGCYLTHVFLQDANYNLSPSVWQNRVFLNRNAEGFFVAEKVLPAGSANANPTLSDYEYVLYAHDAYGSGYTFLASIAEGKILTISGIDVTGKTTGDLGELTVNIYDASQAVSVEKLYVYIGETLMLPVPAKEGAEFGGWYLNEGLTGEPVTSVGAAAEVYASWIYDVSVVVVNNDPEIADGEKFFSEEADRYVIKGVNAFDTLAEALEAVEASGKIYVAPGEYSGAGVINKNGLSIIGCAGAVLKGTISVAANVEGLVMSDLEFTGAANIVIAAAGGVKNFTFKNNTVTGSTRHESTFISFSNNGTAINENFVFENNKFLIEEGNTKAPRWIRGGNIQNLTVVNNIFDGIKGVYVDGVRIEGTDDGNGAGIGAGGVVNILNNEFNNIGQRGIWFRRVSAVDFNFKENTLVDNGDATYGGGLQIEIIVPDSGTAFNIMENTFEDFGSNFGIRFGTAAVPTIGAVVIRFNKFINFAGCPYIDAYPGVSDVDANQNYFDVLPTDKTMVNLPASSYAIAFDDLDDLADAIAHGKPVTLSFDSNGGSAVASQSVLFGKKATKPEDPVREGYELVGWCKNEELTVPFDFDEDVLTDNTTLYAKWKVVESDITYEYNGGALAYETQEDLFTDFLTDLYNYLELTIPLNDFIHGTDKTSGFAGVWADKAGDNFVYLNKLYDGNRPDAPDITKEMFIWDPAYYDKWMPFLDMVDDFIQIVNDTQHFWEKDDTFVGLIRLPQFIKGVKPAAYVTGESMAMMPVYTMAYPTYNITKATTLPTPMKEGFVFGGWYNNSELSGKPMADIPAGLTGDLTLYASWLEITAVEGKIIVNPRFLGYADEQQIRYEDELYLFGVNAFVNVADALAVLENGWVIYLANGEYGTPFTINKNNVSVIGIGDDAVITAKITVSGTNGITLKNLEFTGKGQVYAKGPIDNFTFEDNRVYDSTIAATVYTPNNRVDVNAFIQLYTMDGTNKVGNVTIQNNVFDGIPADIISMDRTSDGKVITIKQNEFRNFGVGVIRFDGGYNNGTYYINDNIFENDELGASAAIVFRAYSAEANKKQFIYVERNTFKNIGDIEFADPDTTYARSAVISTSTFNDKHANLFIRENVFENCVNPLHLRNSGGTVANWLALVNCNEFKGTIGYIFCETEGLADLRFNVYLDDEGNPIDEEDLAELILNNNNYLPVDDGENKGTVIMDSYGNIDISLSEFEFNYDKLMPIFLADWNEFTGDNLPNLAAAAFYASGSKGLTTAPGATKDLSPSNVYKFFNDPDMGEKWGWFLDYMRPYGAGIVHAERQIVAIQGNGTNGDFVLYNADHLLYSIANFFNKAHAVGGFTSVDFTIGTKYLTVKDFNDKVLKDLDAYDTVIIKGMKYILPVPAEITNYTFVHYKVGEETYNPGDLYEISESVLIELIYEAKKWNVKFFDGEDELTDKAATYTHEAAYTLPVLVKEGANFLGWHDNPELDGDFILSIPKGTTGNKVFYAEWEAVDYKNTTVTFDLNDGYVATHIVVTRFHNTTAFINGNDITLNTLTRANWYCLALKEASGLTGYYEVLGKGSGYSNDSATLYLMMHDDCTSSYKAIFTQLYNAAAAGDLININEVPTAAGTGLSVDIYFVGKTSDDVVKEMFMPEEFLTPIKPGYEFGGWFDNAACEGAAVPSYPGNVDAGVSAITYYAKWIES